MEKKTILEEFIKKYPKADLKPFGYPELICPYMLGYENECRFENVDCSECWNREIREV